MSIKNYSNIIPSEVCNWVIKEFEKDSSAGRTISGNVSYAGQELKNDKFLISEDIHLGETKSKSWDEFNIMLHEDYINDVIVDYLSQWKGINYEYTKLILDSAIVSRYDKGEGTFALHQDDVVAPYVRSLTVIAYFNDVYEGGETYFVNQQQLVKPKAGSVLVFPSNFMFAHRGLVPKSEHKYILVTFVDITIGGL